jgi:hypothetical protein
VKQSRPCEKQVSSLWAAPDPSFGNAIEKERFPSNFDRSIVFEKEYI